MAGPSIQIELEIDGQKTTANISRAALTAGRKAGDESGKAFSKNFNSGLANIAVGNIIADATRGAIRLFASEIRQGVSSLRGYSAAVAEANSILGTNEKVTKEVSNQFRQFSEQFGTGQQSQVKAFYSIVSGGVEGTSERLKVLQSANEAAVAGLVDINTAAGALVSSVNAYSKAGLTATEASDQLFTAVRLGQTTFGELSSTIGTVAPIASSLGVEFSELTGAIAGVTTGGIATSKAVTGLAAVFNGVVKPSKEAAEAAKELGIEFGGDAIKNVGGLANFLEILIEKTGGASDQISRLFTSNEALVPILSIAERGVDKFRKALDETADSSGATAKALREIQQSFDFRFSQLEAEVESFRIELAQSLLPAFEAFVPLLKNDILPLLTDFAQGLRLIGQATSFLIQSVSGGNGAEKLEKDFKAVSSQLKDINKELRTIEDIQERGAKTDAERLALGRKRLLIAQQIKLEEQQAALGVQIGERTGENPLQPQSFARFESQRGGEEESQRNEEEGSQELPVNSIINALTRAGEKAQETKVKFGALGQGFSNFFTEAEGKSEEFRQSINKLSGTIVQGFGQALTSSFSAFGAALARGEDALGAFGAAFLKQIGAISTQVGSFFILQGLGFQVLPGFQASGAALLAAGAGLVALGGFLSAVGSDSPASATSGGSNFGTDSQAERDRFEQPEEEERQQTKTNQLVVNGSIFDSDETGSRIIELLNNNFGDEASSLTDARFA